MNECGRIWEGDIGKIIKKPHASRIHKILNKVAVNSFTIREARNFMGVPHAFPSS